MLFGYLFVASVAPDPPGVDVELDDVVRPLDLVEGGVVQPGAAAQAVALGEEAEPQVALPMTAVVALGVVEQTLQRRRRTGLERIQKLDAGAKVRALLQIARRHLEDLSGIANEIFFFFSFFFTPHS